MYKIWVDPDRTLIRAELSGFFSIDEVDDFLREQQAAVRSLHCQSYEFAVLIEATSQVIQAKDVVAPFQRAISAVPIKARKIAIVTSGVLYTMQTRRIIDNGRSALFGDIVEAEQWLAEAE